MQIRKLIHPAAAVLVFAVAAQAQQPAPSSISATISEAIQRHGDGQVQIEAVRTTPVAGVFEVVADSDVFYVDASGRYAFLQARLVDIQARADLTQQRLDDVHRIPWDALPLHLAIKEVRGSGARTFAVFEDALCPICQVFTKFLGQLDDVTIYRFPFPVIHPTDSAKLARVAWCAADRNGTWKVIMDGRRPQGDERCDVTGLVDILKVGERFSINSTPTVVLLDGTRLVGATPPEQFIEAIDKSIAKR